MPFAILFGTTVTTVLHYRADCDLAVCVSNAKINSPHCLVPVYVVFPKVLFSVLYCLFQYPNFISLIESSIYKINLSSDLNNSCITNTEDAFLG